MFENILWAKAAEKAGEKAGATSLDMVEKMIQYQHSLLANTLLALVTIAGFVALGSLIYNIYVSGKKLADIKADIESKITEKINTNFAESVKKLDGIIKAELNLLNGKIRADMAKLTAIGFEVQGNYPLVVATLEAALAVSIGIKDDERIGECTQKLISALNKCKKNDLNPETVACIRKDASALPPILSGQKVEVEKILNALTKH